MFDKKEKEEDNVTFIESDGETIVDLSGNSTVKEESDVSSRIAAAEAETARLREEIASSRANNYQIPNQQYQPQIDSYDKELEGINEREHAMAVQWEMDKASGRLRDKNVVDEYNRKARQFQDEKAAVQTRRAMRDMMPDLVRQQQQMQLRSQYSDVYNNNSALTYAEGAYKMLLASGEPDGPQLLDKAMNQARVQFKMPGANYMRPTKADRDKLSGVPGGGGRTTSDNTVVMDKAAKSMAMAMYSDHYNGDEKKVYEKWAKTIGIKAKKKAASLKNA